MRDNSPFDDLVWEGRRPVAVGRGVRARWRPRAQRLFRRASLLLVLLGAGSACRHAQAQVVPFVPLDVPMPPTRDVEVIEPIPSVVVPLPEEPTRTPPVRDRVSTSVRPEDRPSDARGAEPAADQARPEEPRSGGGAGLRTQPTVQEQATDRRVRVSLADTTQSLNRIGPQGLSGDALQQWETAVRLVSQAEEALRSRNVVFAENLAEKAAALAQQLGGR